MKNIGRAQNTYPGRIQSDTVAVLVLIANTEQHFNVPAGASVAIFSSTVDIYVLANGQTAAVPGVTSTSFPNPNTVPELNPSVLAVVAGTLMSVISSSGGVCGISFYQDTDLS